MDWLIQYSPMHVDRKHKWLSIEFQGQPTVIHGLQPLVPSGALLQVRQVEATHYPHLNYVKCLNLICLLQCINYCAHINPYSRNPPHYLQADFVITQFL